MWEIEECGLECPFCESIVQTADQLNGEVDSEEDVAEGCRAEDDWCGEMDAETSPCEHVAASIGWGGDDICDVNKDYSDELIAIYNSYMDDDSAAEGLKLTEIAKELIESEVTGETDAFSYGYDRLDTTGGVVAYLFLFIERSRNSN